jgi:acetyltransferase-like isoleucine patch superfamily enzyme
MTIGVGSEIAASARISADVTLIMGDCSSIGEDVVISGKGTLTLGDYVKVHRMVWVNVYSDIAIGHNSWIGEKSILDGTAPLTLGDNVAVGTGSQIWTHISFGDTFSGCRLRTSRAITLDNEAWLAGPVLLQAANLAPRVVVMGGSNVIADIDRSNTIWAGNPAIEVTQQMGGPPWDEVSIATKRARFKRLRKAYAAETGSEIDTFIDVDTLPPISERDPRVSYFEVDRRIYTKIATSTEQGFMRWLLQRNKAKFTPA